MESELAVIGERPLSIPGPTLGARGSVCGYPSVFRGSCAGRFSSIRGDPCCVQAFDGSCGKPPCETCGHAHDLPDVQVRGMRCLIPDNKNSGLLPRTYGAFQFAVPVLLAADCSIAAPRRHVEGVQIIHFSPSGQLEQPFRVG